MRILVSAARGRTGRHVVEALRSLSDPPTVRGLVRDAHDLDDVEVAIGDLRNVPDVERALRDVDTVIHYGPTMDPLETSMGISMIDAAERAGVDRFVYISVIHPQIDHLMNHQAKLAVEKHLFNSRLDWTILRPQHYMQNNDIAAIVARGELQVPYSVETPIGHVDMRDLAEAAAIVATTPGHSAASYDIDGGQDLSARQLAAVISDLSGSPVAAREVTVKQAVEGFTGAPLDALPRYTTEGFYRLFGYYSRVGITGNPRVTSWLLGRPPGRFEDYVTRSITAPTPQTPSVDERADHSHGKKS